VKYKHIIWDWNGTLLDDRWLCVESINHVMLKRNLPQITQKKYMDSFCFPVVKYYEKLGFDFSDESFSDVTTDFIEYYKKGFSKARLHDDAEKVLKDILGINLTQSVLSAGEQSSLIAWIKIHRLDNYFSVIKGIKDHYAAGKSEQGKEMLLELPYEKAELLLIGDTIHDSEVAETMGIGCILIANGHVSSERLSKTGRLVFNSIEQGWDYLKSKN
tara:strand:- start:2620 stop:3267 length:648 start_codon:yes stop_codon:yes gene_type:complete